MATTASASPEVCSPTGSVLVTRNPLAANPVCFNYFDMFRDDEHDGDGDGDGCDTAAREGSVGYLTDGPRLPRTQPLSACMLDEGKEEESGDWVTFDTLDPALIRFTLDESDTNEFHTPEPPPESPSFIQQDMIVCEEGFKNPTRAPGHKWMEKLRRRAARRQAVTSIDETLTFRPTSADHFVPREASITSRHRLSSSGSSFGFVEAVKTATLSLASGSAFSLSRQHGKRSSRGHTHTDRSSRVSISSNRCSEDSTCLDRPQIPDKAAVERSLQRRRILEELIRTEEDYIGDVRFLMNVYVTLLVSLPTMPLGLRSSINENLADMLGLHEELLGDMHRAVPHSEYTQLDLSSAPKQHAQYHRRIRSLNVVPEDNETMSWLHTVPGIVADPNVAADVAKAFSNKMKRFFVYEEYGAKYEMMIKDVSSAHRIMPQWESYQKGLETLASSVEPRNRHTGQSKKALTINDLLVKPIQRVCKYPLLFADLLKHTPVSDSPYAHMVIESTLARLREATSEINRATNDVRVKAVIEKTWLLQDRLVFPDSQLDAASKNRIRSFGHIQLCGVLHVCWQSKDGVKGQYMVVLLYKDWFCVASASKADQIYTLQACIPRFQIKTEAADNGRGLQCHTTPYSWKIVFECDCQLYEMMLTACTPKEEDEWRSRLEIVSALAAQEQVGGPELHSSLFLNLKSLGTVFGKQGTVARNISIHRATTVGPKSALCNVIIKNTSVEKDALTAANASINRSQSLLATKGRVPVLAPSRGDRARVEALLSDVWTREVLPFPGMTLRARNEHMIRSSAHSMIRKLSVTSITSTFTRRSASLASVTKGGSDQDSIAGGDSEGVLTSPQASRTETGPVITDLALPNHDRARLSVIADDSDQATPTASRTRKFFSPRSGYAVYSSENAQSPRTRMALMRSPGAWQRHDGIESPLGPRPHGIPPSPSTPVTGNALQPKTTNEPPLRHRASLLSRKSVRSLYSDAKKKLADDHNEEQAKGGDGVQESALRSSSNCSTPGSATSPSKSGGNRWSRVDALRRGAVAQGLRGIFR